METRNLIDCSMRQEKGRHRFLVYFSAWEIIGKERWLWELIDPVSRRENSWSFRDGGQWGCGQGHEEAVNGR